LLNCAPNAGSKAVFEMWLQQDVVHACDCGLCRDTFIGRAGYENDWRRDVEVTQTARKVDAVHVRHLVVDHKAVDLTRSYRLEQVRAVPERSNVKAVRFKPSESSL
jgi:hypothetical protein